MQSAVHMRQQCAQAGVVGSGIVCAKAQCLPYMSSRAQPSSFSLREEIENGERHRGLIDLVPNDPAICEEGGKRVREKEGGTTGSNKYLGD